MATIQEEPPLEPGVRSDYDSKYAHKYDFTVAMSCTGCSGAIRKVLTNSLGSKATDGNEQGE